MAALQNSDAGQYTAEYLTLRKSYQLIVAHFKSQPGDICDAFFQKGYVPPAVRDYVRTHGIPDSEKAQKLVDTLSDKVELDPNIFHGFMNFLKHEGPWADTIVEKLEEIFKKEQANLTFECESKL